MNDKRTDCETIKRDLALHASGDLPPKRARVVEEHVTCCPQCRERLQALIRDVEAARMLGATPGDEARLTHVRRDVLEQVRSGSIRLPARKALRHTLAATCALAVAAVIWLASDDAPTRIAKEAPKTPNTASTAEHSALGEPTVEEEWKQDPVLVKLYVDDPNMVIIWLGD